MAGMVKMALGNTLKSVFFSLPLSALWAAMGPSYQAIGVC
jgi:hypothetical protein